MKNAYAAAVGLPPVLAWPSLAVAQSDGRRTDFWHMGDWSWGHMMFGGGLMMLVFWGALIVLIVVAVLWLKRSGERPPAPRNRSAREILEERFARGEIDEAEFEKRKKALGTDGGRPGQ